MERAIPVNAFSDNYIWLIRIMEKPISSHVAIVDPGDAAPVLETLNKMSLTPDAILITHHHYDHVGGVLEILQHYSIPVYGPASENIPALDVPLKNNDKVTLKKGAITFRVIEVPGHTCGHIAYYAPGMLLCGDTIFAGGCGRLFEGTPKQMYHSLETLSHLPDDTQIYCAHEYTLANLNFALQVEPDNEKLQRRMTTTQQLRANHQPTVPSAMGLEKQTNPFLRCHQPSVIAAAEQYAGKALTSNVEVFTVIRAWKDRASSRADKNNYK